MPKVLCTLPNASTEINGVKFVSHKLGMLSENIDDDVAVTFTAIDGYTIYDPKAAAKKDETGGKEADTGGDGGKETTGGKDGKESTEGKSKDTKPPAGAGGKTEPTF